MEYWVFDNSSDMISIGLNNLEKEMGEDDFKKIEKRLFQMDFMCITDVLNRNNVDISDGQNLFLLLGNTLGNFEEDVLLERINSVMQENDFLLVDNQLKKPGKLALEDEKLLKEAYDTEDMKAYLYAILETANIKEEDGSIEVVTDYSVKSRILQNDNCMTIKLNFVTNKAKRINIGNISTFLNKDTIILVIYSRKYTKVALNTLLKVRFKFFDKHDFSTDKYALILCQKK